MSARSQRGVNVSLASKRLRSPRVALKNRALKPQHVTYDYDAAISQPDVPNLLDYKRIGHPMVKRPYPIKGKSVASKNDCSVENNRHGKNSGNVIEEEINYKEKENVTSNGVLEKEDLSNTRGSLTVHGKSISCKEASEVIKENQNGGPRRNERLDDSDNTVGKSPILQVKGSKIPRARMTTSPANTIQETCQEMLPMNPKVKECGLTKCQIAGCAIDNIEVPEETVKNRSTNKEEEHSCKQDTIDKLQNDLRIAWNDGKASTLEADEEEEDRGLSSTDESPAIINEVDDPRVSTILRSLKLSCPCKTCTNRDLPSSGRQEEEGNSKSLSQEDARRKKWPRRYRKQIYSTSEDLNESSEYNSDEGKRNKKIPRNPKCSKTKHINGDRIKVDSIVNANSKLSGQRRSNFSFFNALFDIVFWPYLFLKTKR